MLISSHSCLVCWRLSEILFGFVFPFFSFQVCRSGRFGNKSLAVSFCGSEDDEKVLNRVQKRLGFDFKHLSIVGFHPSPCPPISIVFPWKGRGRYIRALYCEYYFGTFDPNGHDNWDESANLYYSWQESSETEGCRPGRGPFRNHADGLLDNEKEEARMSRRQKQQYYRFLAHLEIQEAVLKRMAPAMGQVFYFEA